jgi:hypothetical protein
MPHSPSDSPLNIAEAVRAACLKAALQAYEDAGISGLCQEGRWESAVAAIRDLDLDRVLHSLEGPDRTRPA